MFDTVVTDLLEGKVDSLLMDEAKAEAECTEKAEALYIVKVLNQYDSLK